MAQTDSFQEHERKKYFARLLEEKLAFIILAPLLAILLTVFVFHFYRVDGSSMEHTFQNNDLLLVEKLGKTTSSVLRKDYVPQRYDVIVFKQPNYDPDIELVKRVIGLPGDKVIVKNNEVKVYNEQNPDGIAVDNGLPGESRPVGFDNKTQKLTATVGRGEIYVLGDNRSGSDDSRVFGPVKTNNIVGKVIMRIMPFDNFLIL